MAVGFGAPPVVPAPVVPLPLAGVLLVIVVPAGLLPLFVPAFVPPVEPLPLVAGVDGFVLGNEVIGVGTSGIGVERTLATSSFTFASVAVLLRYL